RHDRQSLPSGRRRVTSDKISHGNRAKPISHPTELVDRSVQLGAFIRLLVLHIDLCEPYIGDSSRQTGWAIEAPLTLFLQLHQKTNRSYKLKKGPLS
ncbi:MAG: hypothetical protein ACREDT_12625, partial [Methylocella sp.]